ncbi:MAG TPA: serine/threonine-protein kinase, partial [Vicinamibacteria bacterium]|nr:serine/threonine-protein kinase [Vicinamibacteria bacterium]
MRYETAVPIGSGGMGEVYKAFDPVLKRWVALKYPRWDRPGVAERFLREARLQARVDHEGVCRVYEIGDDEGRSYIAMQYIEGRTLDVAAAEMSQREKVEVLRLAAEAVHAAHQTGLVHRDLKPHNIMVEREGASWRPYVMDFGLAR